jgi:hypothetical protein
MKYESKYLSTFRRHDDPLQNIGNVVTTFEVFSFRSGVTQKTVALRYKVAFRGSIVFLYLRFEIPKNIWLLNSTINKPNTYQQKAKINTTDGQGIFASCTILFKWGKIQTAF